MVTSMACTPPTWLASAACSIWSLLWARMMAMTPLSSMICMALRLSMGRSLLQVGCTVQPDAFDPLSLVGHGHQGGLDHLAGLQLEGRAVVEGVLDPGGRIAGEGLQSAVVSPAVPRVVIVSPINLPHPQVGEPLSVPGHTEANSLIPVGQPVPAGLEFLEEDHIHRTGFARQYLGDVLQRIRSAVLHLGKLVAIARLPQSVAVVGQHLHG